MNESLSPGALARLDRRMFLRMSAAAFVWPGGSRRARGAGAARVRALIVTGQMNRSHRWEVSSVILRRLLESAGRFDVSIATSPPKGADMAGFKPAWNEHDVVVVDYDGDDWPQGTRAAFVEYVARGGGLVIYHSTDNAFPQWKEFNEMIGLGGWGGRDESCGPKVRWRDGGVVLDPGPGTATHPPQHEYAVTVRDPEHPVTRGVPPVWMHARDELYSQLRGPAKNLRVLATGFADQKLKNATGEHEPVLFTVAYGKGRVFHTTLGHVGARDVDPVPAMNCVGFATTFLRGAEWAGTGSVTLPVPGDFPGATRVSVRA